MKIKIDRISPQGLVLDELVSPAALDLAEGDIRLQDALKVHAQVSRVSDEIFVDLQLDGCLVMTCSRCLEEVRLPLHKQAQHEYSFDKTQLVIDLIPDIRDDLILDFPIQPLCSQDCKGLCPQCGANRNQNKGVCHAITEETTFQDPG